MESKDRSAHKELARRNQMFVDLVERRKRTLQEARETLRNLLVSAGHPMPLEIEVDLSGGDLPESLVRRSAEVLAMIKRSTSSINEVDKLLAGMETLSMESRALEHMELAAKVLALVPLHQKKLLNFGHDWLCTFLPHCMAKVNRVSFGLLTELECRQAVKAEPNMPRSRLKLAVPFLGKDVPSTSSEFAHPDVIVGLTIMAYRYSGLRETDFTTVMDSLTSEFVNDIGPAKERASNVRYNEWVLVGLSLAVVERSRYLCVEKCRHGVVAQNAHISCDDVQVVGCLYSGVLAYSGGTVKLSGETTRIEGNVTGGRSDLHGLTAWDSSSKIQIVTPLTKDTISFSNRGGGNWGGPGTIEQVSA